jgi:hypothetical protein
VTSKVLTCSLKTREVLLAVHLLLLAMRNEDIEVDMLSFL